MSLIQAGNYAEVAAQHVGIDPSTYYNWMKRGREAKSGIYLEFFNAVKSAETHAEVRAVTLIQRHMANNWQAAMTYLERKFPAKWGRRAIEVTGRDGGPIQVDAAIKVEVSKLSDEDLERLDEIERRASAETGNPASAANRSARGTIPEATAGEAD